MDFIYIYIIIFIISLILILFFITSSKIDSHEEKNNYIDNILYSIEPNTAFEDIVNGVSNIDAARLTNIEIIALAPIYPIELIPMLPLVNEDGLNMSSVLRGIGNYRIDGEEVNNYDIRITRENLPQNLSDEDKENIIYSYILQNAIFEINKNDSLSKRTPMGISENNLVTSLIIKGQQQFATTNHGKFYLQPRQSYAEAGLVVTDASEAPISFTQFISTYDNPYCGHIVGNKGLFHCTLIQEKCLISFGIISEPFINKIQIIIGEKDENILENQIYFPTQTLNKVFFDSKLRAIEDGEEKVVKYEAEEFVAASNQFPNRVLVSSQKAITTFTQMIYSFTLAYNEDELFDAPDIHVNINEDYSGDITVNLQNSVFYSQLIL